MKKLLLYLMAAGFMPAFVSAQSNFRPGYVINGDDTLKGFVDYRNWQENPSDISFKKDVRDKEATKYTPAQVKAFALTGLEYYYSYNVKISQDQVEMSNIKQGADTSSLFKMVFLHLLLAGKNVSLFDYTDNIKTRYYILDEAESQPRELTYKIFYSLQDNTQVQTSYAYRNQLEFLAAKYHVNSSKLEQDIAESRYSESELVKIAKSINGDSVRQFTPKSRFGLGWIASVGINSNNLAFPLLLNYGYNSSLFPQLSLGFDLFPNVNTQKVLIRCDLSFTQSTHSFSHDSTGYESSIKNLVQSSFTVTPQVLFNLYNSTGLQIFVGAGVSVNFSSYNNYALSQTIGSTAPQFLYKYPELDNFWINFPLKAGVTLNRKIEIFASYSPATMISPGYSDVKGQVYEYAAGVGYRFGTK